MDYKRLTPQCTEIRMKYKAGFEQSFLLTSDWHFDNPLCNRKVLFKHLDYAKERNAKALLFGDIFCCMQGKYDKRANKSKLRPEHQVDNYLDAIVKTTAEDLEHYKDLIYFLSPGNHESSVLKRNETNLTERLSEHLEAICGTYAGWLVFTFEHEAGGRTRRYNLNYNHGYGGGGPVTKDVIQTNRKAVYLPDADIVVSGHTHDQWVVPVTRIRLLGNGEQERSYQYHVKTGNYKDEFSCGEGWAVEMGMPPKPIGSVLATFKYESGNIAVSFENLLD